MLLLLIIGKKFQIKSFKESFLIAVLWELFFFPCLGARWYNRVDNSITETKKNVASKKSTIGQKSKLVATNTKCHIYFEKLRLKSIAQLFLSILHCLETVAKDSLNMSIILVNIIDLARFWPQSNYFNDQRKNFTPLHLLSIRGTLK